MVPIFQGYLSFAGTEIANAARTKAYADHLLPAVGLMDAYEAADLPCILGEGPYGSPATDPAPWYSPHRPTSGSFFGFYPTGIVGVEDSSYSVKVTELVSDGGVVSLPRHSTKQIRVQGLLVGASEESVSYGLTWLQGALKGSNCHDDDCTGDSLCYLAWLPKCCNYNNTDRYPAVPLYKSTATAALGEWIPYLNGALTQMGSHVVLSMPCKGDGAQYQVSGLIPGQHYRVAVDMATSDLVTLEVAGVASFTAEQPNVHFSPVAEDKNTWVLDFVASQENATVRVTSAVDGCNPAQVDIYGIMVRRTPGKSTRFLPRFNLDNISELPSWTVDTPPAGTSVNRLNLAEESIQFYWSRSGSAVAIPAGSGVSRVMRGFDPGLSYRVLVKVSFSDSQTPAFDVPGAQGVLTTDLGDNWYAVSFAATAPQHQLRIETSASVNVSTGNPLYMRVFYVRAELDEFRMLLPVPDQAEAALRTLYQVSLLDGPRVLRNLDVPAGAMAVVEFVLVSAHPFAYSPLVDIEGGVSSPSPLVPEVVCSNGYPVRVNYFTNPTFSVAPIGLGEIEAGVDTYDEFLYDADDIVLSQAAPNSLFNTTSLEMESTTSLPGGDPRVEVQIGAGLTEGHIYTMSCLVGQTAPQPSQGFFARCIEVETATGSYFSNSHPNLAGVSHLQVTFRYTAGTRIYLWHGGEMGGPNVFWTQFLFEEVPYAGTFFDGDSPDSEWLGDPGESNSMWVRQATPLIVDPDCPPIPAPPTAPSIDLACPPEVEEWRRYSVSIPARESGGWKEAVPVLTLTTMSSEVRHVRVRFYADAFNRGADAINPCDYCGEFFVAYVPADTTMTIDGILRQAYADVAGTGSQTVMNLISSFDGGPIQWPELSCDIAYVMTVDIAPAEVLDLDVRLAVAQRE